MWWEKCRRETNSNYCYFRHDLICIRQRHALADQQQEYKWTLVSYGESHNATEALELGAPYSGDGARKTLLDQHTLSTAFPVLLVSVCRESEGERLFGHKLIISKVQANNIQFFLFVVISIIIAAIHPPPVPVVPPSSPLKSKMMIVCSPPQPHLKRSDATRAQEIMRHVLLARSFVACGMSGQCIYMWSTTERTSQVSRSLHC